MKKIFALLLCVLFVFNSSFLAFARPAEKTSDQVVTQEMPVQNIVPVDIPLEIVPEAIVPVPEVIVDPQVEPDEQSPVVLGEQENLPNADGQLAQAAAGEAGDDTIPNNTPSASSKDNLPKAGASGALIFSYPIDVPSGRNGFGPQLQLSYNSQDLENESIFGYGWTLSGIPEISRSNKIGTDQLYTTDQTKWFLTSSLSGELTKAGTNTFKAKSDDGTMLTYIYNPANQSISVIDKSGTTYLFGSTAASRQDNPANPNEIYRWMITSITDSNGNQIFFNYTKDAGQIYPETVSYGGVYQIQFSKQSRLDNYWNYKRAFLVQSNSTISAISVMVSGQLSKKYLLGYSGNPTTNRSRLANIQVQADGTTYPATSFSYQVESAKGFERVQLPNEIGLDSGSFQQVTDINGDGYTDALVSNESQSLPSQPYTLDQKISLFNPKLSQFDSSTLNFPTIFYGTYDSGWGQSYAENFIYPSYFVDVNGDLLPDAVSGANVGESNFFPKTPHQELSTGSGWIPTNTWSPGLIGVDRYHLYSTNNPYHKAHVSDVNGDGFTDFLTLTSVSLNTGSNYAIKSANCATASAFACPKDGASYSLVDINGDGLPDFVSDDKTTRRILKIALNTGNGWAPETTYTLPDLYDINHDYLDYNSREFVDLNNDGFVDIIVDSVAKLINNGRTWVYDTEYNENGPILWNPRKNDNRESWRNKIVGEWNGDGSPDAYFGSAREWSNDLWRYVYYSNIYLRNKNSNQVDLLSLVTLPTGGTSTISYKSSAQYKDANGNLLNPKLPIIIQTVNTVTTTDPVTNISSTDTYSYADGFYYFDGANPLNKKFAGFGKVTKTDGTGDVTETYFHQGNSTDIGSGEYADSYEKIGKLYRSVQKNSSGQIFAQSFTRWNSVPTSVASTAFFVAPSQTVSQSWDGTGSHRDTAMTYVYDNLGNPTMIKNWGEVSGGNDGSFTDISDKIITKHITYTSTPLSAPCLIQVFDGSNTKLSETRITYDNLGSCQATKGNATLQENWLKESASYVSTSKSYNSYGQILSTTDPRGNSTTITYDANSLYPATTTNALLQTTQTQYDISTGQLLQTIDPNGAKTKNTYDGLGRLTKVEITDPAVPSNMKVLSIASYNDIARPVQVSKRVFNGSAGDVGIEEVSYYDGFGKLIQTRSTTEGSNQYIVKSQTYDQKNRLKTEYLPIFQSGNSYTSPVGQTNTYQYDTLDRVTSISNVLGTSSFMYTPWRKHSFDANSHEKVYSYDAFGNLATVEEVNDSEVYTTNYSYDPLNRLSKITDAEGFVRNFTYDSLGRLLSQELPHVSSSPASIITYSYDAANNLTSKKDAKDQTIVYSYDALNRPTNEDFSGALPMHITYTYDAGTYGKGRRSSVANSVDGVSTSYTYDILGRALSQAQTIGASTQIQSQTYDLTGNVLTKTHPNGVVVNYTYDNAHQLATIKYGTNALVNNFDYAPIGGVSRIDYANGTSTVNAYDANKMYRLVNKKTTKGTDVYQDISYTFDPVGNIMTLTENAPNENRRSVTYMYDDLDRLLSATYADPNQGSTSFPPPQVTPPQTFTYSPTGNILSQNGNKIYYYTNPSLPQAVTSTALTNITTLPISYTYDNNGNRITQNRNSYTYDVRDRMVSSRTAKTDGMKYLYDTNNARISKWNRDNGNLSLYFGDYEVETKADAMGLPITTDPTRINRVNINIGGTQIATLEYSETNNVTPTNISYHHTDHLTGSSVETDTTGARNQTMDYMPFGSVRINAKTGTHDNKHKFTGKELDPESNLMYYGARYYDQELGRFTGVDPLILAPQSKKFQQIMADPQQINPYTYARNNPLKYLDPTGMWNQLNGQVEKGDTLNDITNQINLKYGTSYSVDQIANLNKIENKNLIYVGQKVVPNILNPEVTDKLNSLMRERSTDPRLLNPYYFKDKVDSRHEWDLKHTADFDKDIFEGFVYNGSYLNKDAPGNIQYGYVGKSTIATESYLLYKAGEKQQQNGTSTEEWMRTNIIGNGDDPYDTQMIQYGFQLYKDDHRFSFSVLVDHDYR